VERPQNRLPDAIARSFSRSHPSSAMRGGGGGGGGGGNLAVWLLGACLLVGSPFLFLLR
jgi:hypothetical protein